MLDNDPLESVGEVGYNEDRAFLNDTENKDEPIKVKLDDKVDEPVKPKEEEVEEVKLSEDEEDKTEKLEEEQKFEAIDFVTNRPTWSQINKEFPEFFKKFPQMRHIIGREMAYSEVFPSVQDAEESKEDATAFEYLNEQFEKGNMPEISKLMKETSTESYNTFVDNFLPNLYKEDQQSFYKVTTPIIQNLLSQVYSAAKGRDQNLENATLLLCDHLFGDEKIVERPAQPQVQKQDDSVKKEREDYYKERLNESRSEISNSCISSLQDAIFDDFVSQFPNGEVPSNMKEFISDSVESAIRNIDKSLLADKGHLQLMNSLWRRAFNARFTGDWEDRIKDAYLSRAKELIAGQRKKIMPFIPKKPNGPSERHKIPSGSPSSNLSRNHNSKEIDWDKTSDRDFLDDKISLKG